MSLVIKQLTLTQRELEEMPPSGCKGFDRLAAIMWAWRIGATVKKCNLQIDRDALDGSLRFTQWQ